MWLSRPVQFYNGPEEKNKQTWALKLGVGFEERLLGGSREKRSCCPRRIWHTML